ncbi:MAG: hypothetical protein ACI4HN_09060 [Ruminococcus sp.]
MRKFTLPDAFAFARILKAADIKNEVINFAKEILARKNKKQKINIEEIGLEFVITIITAAADVKVEEKIYSFLSSVCEMDIENIKKLNLAQIKEIIKIIIAENDLKTFFQSASALM